VEWLLMLLSVGLAAAGYVLATRFYKTDPRIPEQLATRFAGPHRWLLNKYYVDELYDEVVVKGLAITGGNALHGVDRFGIDGGDGEVRPGLGVNGIAWLSRDVVARASNFWDRWVVDGLVNLTGLILDNASYLFRAVQNGLVQHYALVMLIGVFLIIGAGRLILGLY
jgi:NADH-quinone oxidoreductase subunit L